MAKSKEYEMAIKIAGQVEQSFKNSMGLTERELRNIARQAAASSNAARNSFSTGFQDASKVMNTFSGGAKKVLKVVATAATATATAVTGIAAAATKVGSDFEAQMSTVKAISGATSSEMESLNAKAKELGEATAFSASEAGEAMEYMAMAGWKTKDMLNGIDGIMSLAAASGEELGTVSDIVTDALTAFGLTAKDVNGFADDLAQAARSSNTDVSTMGESFKQVATAAGALNYSTKDVAVALGVMANSGLKGEKAGTQLAKMFTRMSGTNQNATKAMKELGLEMFNSDGSARDLSSVMKDLRTTFSNLTPKQKEYYAYLLAGQSGMNGLLAIVNTSNKDFNTLTESINDSAGAAKEMSEIKLDNLQGDTTLFQSATEGLGIEIYEQMNGGLRGAMQTITSEVGNVTEYIRDNPFIEEFADDVKESIPTLVRNFKDAGASIAEFSEPFINIAEWMFEHPEVVESTLAGIATTIVTFKVASKLQSVATGFSSLATVLTNPFAVAILAVGAAIGGAAGIATYIKKCETEMKNQNLAEHFGDISLSLDELKDVANRILDDGSLTKLNTALEEFEKVDEIVDGIDDTVKSLNKMNWKVEVGMELSKNEKKQYQENIKSYITQTQELVEQDRYAISLNLNLLTDGDGKLTSQVDTYFSGKQKELAKLGKKLQKTVNKAFGDGLLTIDEEQKIQDIQAQMAAISDGLTKSNFDANMQITEKEYEGKMLDVDSFKNMQDELQKQVDEAQKGYKQALQESLAVEASMLNDGSITQAEYKQNVDDLWNKYNEKVGETQKKASDFELSTIMGQYNDDITAASNAYNEILAQYMSRETDWTNESGSMWEHFIGQLDGKLMSDDTAAAIEDLLNQLEPAKENLVKLKQSYEEKMQSYEEAGKKVPEDITKGLQEVENSLNQITQLEAFSGDEDSLWVMIQDTLLNNEDYMAMIEKVQEAGGYIPEEIRRAMASNSGELKQAAKEAYDTEQQALNSEFSKDLNVNMNVKADQATRNAALKSEASSTYAKMKEFLQQEFKSPFDLAMKVRGATTTTTTTKVAHNAKGSIIKKPTLSWFAEDGPEAAIPLDGSQRAKSLWIEAGQILGMYQNGTEGSTMMSQAEQMMNTDSSASVSSKSLKMLEGASDNSTSNTITYAPQITITGNASKEDVEAASQTAQEKFEEMMERYLRNQSRISFS